MFKSDSEIMSHRGELVFHTTSNSLVVQCHMLVTAKLHLFDGSPSADNGCFGDRQKHFRQQGGTAVSNRLIHLKSRKRNSPVKTAKCVLAPRHVAHFSALVNCSGPGRPPPSGKPHSSKCRLPSESQKITVRLCSNQDPNVFHTLQLIDMSLKPLLIYG